MLSIFIGAAALAVLAVAAAGFVGYRIGRNSASRQPIQALLPRLEAEWQADVADFATHNDFARAHPFIVWMHRHLEPLHSTGFFEAAYARMNYFGEDAYLPRREDTRPRPH